MITNIGGSFYLTSEVNSTHFHGISPDHKEFNVNLSENYDVSDIQLFDTGSPSIMVPLTIVKFAFVKTRVTGSFEKVYYTRKEGKYLVDDTNASIGTYDLKEDYRVVSYRSSVRIPMNYTPNLIIMRIPNFSATVVSHLIKNEQLTLTLNYTNDTFDTLKAGFAVSNSFGSKQGYLANSMRSYEMAEAQSDAPSKTLQKETFVVSSDPVSFPQGSGSIALKAEKVHTFIGYLINMNQQSYQRVSSPDICILMNVPVYEGVLSITDTDKKITSSVGINSTVQPWKPIPWMTSDNVRVTTSVKLENNGIYQIERRIKNNTKENMRVVVVSAEKAPNRFTVYGITHTPSKPVFSTDEIMVYDIPKMELITVRLIVANEVNVY